jgi:hypothetical protein
MASSILNSDDGVISGTSGLKSTGGDDGNLVFQSKGTETARINTDKQIVAAAGTASLPIYSTTGDTNTGIFFPAADTIAFAEGGAEAMRIDSSGNVGIGTTSITSASGYQFLQVNGTTSGIIELLSGGARIGGFYNDPTGSSNNGDFIIRNIQPGALILQTNNTERARIDSSGNVGIGTTSPVAKLSVAGIISFDSGSVRSLDYPNVTASTGFVDITVSTSCLGFMAIMNRRFDDGTPSTNRTYSIFFANGNASFQQIHEYAEGGGASFTVTSPSAGVIRITNTYVLNSDIEVLLMIRNTSTI